MEKIPAKFNHSNQHDYICKHTYFIFGYQIWVILINKVNSSEIFAKKKQENINKENCENPKIKRKILFVLHEGSGGTPKTVLDLANNIYNHFECYLLTSNGILMKLSIFDGDKFNQIEHYELKAKWLVEGCYSEEFSNAYLKFLTRYSFDIVHIHHLIFHSFDLPKLCFELEIPVILSIHDLYFICPAYTLLDGDYKYCGGECTNSNSDKNCFMPMGGITNIGNMKIFVDEWRNSVFQMFSYIDYFISPSEFIKDIILKNYELPEDKISIIEHGIDYNEANQNLFEIPNIDKPTKILFLGNLYLQKGVPAIKKLYEIDKDKKLEFHFLGFAPDELSKIGINHGPYDNKDLNKHIEKIKPSFIGIFTLTGESYCYTLSESWSFGIPVLASDLGALKERVLKNGGGWLIDINDMEKSYNKIISIIDNEDEYKSKQNVIKDIPLNSTKIMSHDYLEIYKALIKENEEENMLVFTSICMNYLPKALVLGDSLKKHNPNIRFFVILVEKEIPECWPDIANDIIDEVILAKDLGFDDFNKFIFKHSLVEASTSIKGQALCYLLENESDKVVYIDPDIKIYNSLDELSNLLNHNDIILTPHLTIPETKEEDIIHNEICALQHGIYNLGFLAVRNSEEGLKFARWWRDRLSLFCYDDIPQGIFTDQRWIDFAPAYFNVHILKNPGYNMAPWNLSTRKLEFKNNKLLVNEEFELIFFHFSGLDSGANEIVFNRYVPDKKDVIYILRDEYIGQMDFYGQEELGKSPWSYDYYLSGEKINQNTRILYRNNKLDHSIDKDPFSLNDEKIKKLLE